MHTFKHFQFKDLKDDLIFLKTVQALTPTLPPKDDFVLQICEVYDDLRAFVKLQMQINTALDHKYRMQPKLKDSLEMVVRTIKIIGEEQNEHVLSRPGLKMLFDTWIEQ